MYTFLNKPVGNIGKKAENLNKILSKSKDLNFIVPKGLIVTTDFYFELLKQQKDYKRRKNYIISKIKISAESEQDLISKVREVFGNRKLVIRSSATCEDSIFFSAAGQYKSYINLKTDKELKKAIVKIYNSFTSENAKLYAEINNVNLNEEGMAILIQEVVPVKMSGVLFTINPINNKREFLIEYTEGLGIDVVSGNKNINREIIVNINKYNGNQIFKKLILVGREIEKIFGCPQDIEWGTDGKDLYIFQSRPAITFKYPKYFDTAYDLNKKSEGFFGQIVSKGIDIGYLKKYKSLEKNQIKKNKGYILLQKSVLNSEDIKDIINSSGIIMNTGGCLSHFSNIYREFRKPAILFSKIQTIDKLLNKLILIDAFTGMVFFWDNLSEEEKIFYFWKFLKYKFLLKEKRFNEFIGIESIKHTIKYEQVFFEIQRDEISTNLISFGAIKIFNGIQNIITYDYPNKVLGKGKIVFRIQYDNSKQKVRVQAKKLYSIKNKYRKEDEILIFFKDLEKAVNFIKSRGLIKTGYQERKIVTYKLDDVIFNFITWPNSSTYLGIEAASTDDLDLYCKKIKLDNSNVTYTDGKKIFTKLNLKINKCKF